MKTNNHISAYILRCSTAALLFSCVIVALCSAINLSEQPAKAFPPQDNAAFGAKGQESRSLSFADRVAYQRAIEEVYWRHRIWPRNRGERPDPKPSLEAVMSQAAFEKKVQEYLRNSEFQQVEFFSPPHCSRTARYSQRVERQLVAAISPARNSTTQAPAPGRQQGSLAIARAFHTATMLADGRVLVAGGNNTASAEIYDPTAGSWTVTGSLNTAIIKPSNQTNRSKCGEETYPGDLFAHPDL
jgi:hypothetical protein